ncbi:hypothetical protein AB0P17_03915 [Streptomyces sp. NPDC088124]|uniref:hypothetical protein n=1 Tax=Streptomyces sp. NPDC088124 TaxID=3154654 RepID=UPI00341D1C4D
MNHLGKAAVGHPARPASQHFYEVPDFRATRLATIDPSLAGTRSRRGHLPGTVRPQNRKRG